MILVRTHENTVELCYTCNAKPTQLYTVILGTQIGDYNFYQRSLPRICINCLNELNLKISEVTER